MRPDLFQAPAPRATSGGTADSVLDDDFEHTRPLSRPGAACAPALGRAVVLALPRLSWPVWQCQGLCADRAVFPPRWRSSPSAAPTPCWPTSRSRRSRPRLAAARRDARWARHGRDDARAADHGAPVRGLHGRLSRCRRRCRRGWRALLGALIDDLGDVRALLPVDLPGAPFVETLRGNRALTAALSAITAAVVGVILNLAVWFALHVLFARGARGGAGGRDG